MQLGRRPRSWALKAKNLALGANAASLRLLLTPRRMVDYATQSLFLLSTVDGPRGIPTRSVFDVLPCESVEEVKIASLQGDKDYYFFTQGGPFLADLLSLCLICRITRATTIFEIGTCYGYTALHLALNSPPNARVYTLDIPIGAPLEPKLKTSVVDEGTVASREPRAATGRYLCFEGMEAASKITCLYADSAAFDYSPFHRNVDLFFIDGAHSYDYVRSDTLNAFKCCHPGSVIAWHDYGRAEVYGVTRWLNELCERRKIYRIPGGSLAFSVF